MIAASVCRGSAFRELPKLSLLLLAAVIVATPAAAESVPSSSYQALQWRSIGPFRGTSCRPCARRP